MALTIFIMAILSEAFARGLEAMRKLKGVSRLENELRIAATIIRRDLQASHFEGDRKLSRFGAGLGNFQPPEHGFFSIREGISYYDPITDTVLRRPSIPEGKDASGRVCERDYYDVNPGKFVFNFGDSLHFTSRLNGNRREDFFYARVPLGSALDNIGFEEGRYEGPADGIYASQWAEIVYFLQPTGQTTDSGLQLFNLYRRELPLVPESFSTGSSSETRPTTGLTAKDKNGQDVRANYPTPAHMIAPLTPFPEMYHVYFNLYEVSAYAIQPAPPPITNTYTFAFNSPADVQYPQRRFNYGNPDYPVAVIWNPPTQPVPTGADVLLTNVVSFDVKLWDPWAIRIDILPPGGPPLIAHEGEFVDLVDGGAGISNETLAMYDAVYKARYPSATVSATRNPFSAFSGGGPNSSYDTWSSRNGQFNYSNHTVTPIPYPFPIKAIQIKIRIWDRRTQQTREITIVQDM